MLKLPARILAMKPVKQLQLVLAEERSPWAVPGAGLRNFKGNEGVPACIDVRHRAFAGERVGVGLWTAADFEREFTAKPGWHPEDVWFAEVVEPGSPSRRV